MDEIVETMMEHVCDKICRFPQEITDQEQLEDICVDCRMGRFVCDILNTYNAPHELTAVIDKHKGTEIEQDKQYSLLRKEMQEDGICEPDIEMAIKKIKQLRQEN